MYYIINDIFVQRFIENGLTRLCRCATSQTDRQTDSAALCAAAANTCTANRQDSITAPVFKNNNNKARFGENLFPWVRFLFAADTR